MYYNKYLKYKKKYLNLKKHLGGATPASATTTPASATTTPAAATTTASDKIEHIPAETVILFKSAKNGVEDIFATIPGGINIHEKAVDEVGERRREYPIKDKNGKIIGYHNKTIREFISGSRGSKIRFKFNRGGIINYTTQLFKDYYKFAPTDDTFEMLSNGFNKETKKYEIVLCQIKCIFIPKK